MKKFWKQYRRIELATSEEEVKALDVPFSAEMCLHFLEQMVKPSMGKYTPYTYYFAQADAIEVEVENG